MNIEFKYLIYGAKMTYSEFYNNIKDEDAILSSHGFEFDDKKIYAIIDEIDGSYVYVGNILSKTDDKEFGYKNANPLSKHHIQTYLDELFDESFVVRPILYRSISHYY